ncbi:MAG: acyltransferase [Methylobacter sp.]
MYQSIIDRFIGFLARSVLRYYAHMPAELFVNNQDIRSFVLKISCTPVIFGGGRERVITGKNVKLVNSLLNVTSGTISIGDNTFFGHNVMVLTGTHNIDMTGVDRQTFPTSGRDITIGNGVWIASGAIILGPCEIGDNAVVSAGAVVCGGRLESGCIYAGIPARKIRKTL